MTDVVRQREMPEITAGWLLARCRDDGGGCLIWAGYSQQGHPKANWGDGPFNVRRLIWFALTGRAPRRDRIYVSVCRTHNCVEPAHIRERLYASRNAGRVQTIENRMALAAAQRAKSHLDAAAIADMRSRRLTQDEFAEIYRISQTMVSRIQLHMNWVDLRNPYLQLGTR